MSMYWDTGQLTLEDYTSYRDTYQNDCHVTFSNKVQSLARIVNNKIKVYRAKNPKQDVPWEIQNKASRRILTGPPIN